MHAPHLIDVEVVHALRGLMLRGDLDESRAATLVMGWRRFGVRRAPIEPLLGRIWELRHNLSAYDASYVALAESLRCPLVTADHRLAAAPGLQCRVEVVPR